MTFHKMPVALRCLLLILSISTARADGLEGAQWIWFTTDSQLPLPQFPDGSVFFRAALSLPTNLVIKSANLFITADNLYDVYLNGKPAGQSSAEPNDWNQPRRFDVAALLQSGRNVLAIEAVNTSPGPAGLIAKLIVYLADHQQVVLVTDGSWKASDTADVTWQQFAFDDLPWPAARVLGAHGMAPWGQLHAAIETVPASPLSNEATPDFKWPEAIIFVGDDCSLYRGATVPGAASLDVTIFNPRNSKAFPEHDLPAPMKVGHKLFALRPAKPGMKPELLLDAGKGALGSPTVSFDGKWIYVSMAAAGDAFYHIYRLPSQGGQAQRLTYGPFHDIDPAELPDGRLAFTSTRTGTFEEYHNPPSRALFTMRSDGADIRPLTSTFIFDNEPEVLADGRLLFIRTDNFFDRGKVETLLHAVHPDGTHGYTEFGLDNGPEYGGRLRAYNVGSPAPMPDGRVAFVTGSDIVVGRPGNAARDLQHLRVAAGDVAALPDGRLLCTTGRGTSYTRIGIVDPQSRSERVTLLYDSPGKPLHSPVYLGPRPKPPLQPTNVNEASATSILFCQNARFTKNTTAGWSHVRAIRVLAGKGLTTRSSHSYIVHAGSEVVELGTVPLAPDGSFAVEVPADTAIALQAVDAEGRSELNEMSWIYVRPGEKRGCVGCHQPRQNTPQQVAPVMQAARTPPLKLLGNGDPHRFRGNNAAVTGLMELQFDRYREVAGLNRHTVDVATLLRQLRGPDAALRLTAAQRLAILRDSRAAPVLVTRLGDSSREVRVAVAFALATCGTRDSVAPLQVAAKDADPLVAQAAAIALENLTGNTTEDELIRRLKSPDRDVVRRAAVALGHTGGDAARGALREYVTRERDNNPLPAWRKNHQGDGARFNSLEAVNPRTIQAATRALGYLKDETAVPLLVETLSQHSNPTAGNLFLAEACAEALGRIGTTEAEAALIAAFARLGDYPRYTSWYGDHGALMACHASPVHYFIIEALDALSSTNAAGLVPHLIGSVPTDFDRALMFANDDYETVTGNVIRRNDPAAIVIETCLAILGDASATRTKPIADAIAKTHGAWAGKPNAENRAAQILSLVCRDRQYEPRIRAAFERYEAKPNTIERVFSTGIPVVNALPVRHWVCFFLARSLGNLGDARSVDTLLAALEKSPTEFANGSPDPLGPGVLFLHNDLTPCWRAAAAWGVGRIGDNRAVPVLLQVVGDLNNAPDTRHAAAEALERLAVPSNAEAISTLARQYPETATRKVLLRVSAQLTAYRQRDGGESHEAQ